MHVQELTEWLQFPAILALMALGIFLMAAIVSVYYQARVSWRNAKLARVFSRARSLQIAQISPGYAAVKGRTSASEPLLSAPITGRPCLFWMLEVFYDDEQGVSVWFPSRVAEKSSQCVVDDGTGLATVNLAQAEIQWVEHPYELDAARGEITESLEKKVNSMIGPDSTVWSIRTCRETILQEGDFVFVMGAVTLDGGRVRLSHGDSMQPLVVMDGRRDLLSERHWRAFGWRVIETIIVAVALLLLVMLMRLLRDNS